MEYKFTQNSFIIILDAFDAMMMVTTFHCDEIKKALIGVSRDLRGIAYAFNAKPPYMMFFDWM